MNRTKGWATLMALVLAGTANAQDAGNVFKIGVVVELSGDNATGGNVAKRGYDL